MRKKAKTVNNVFYKKYKKISKLVLRKIRGTRIFMQNRKRVENGDMPLHDEIENIAFNAPQTDETV